MADSFLDEQGIARLWERFKRDHGDVPRELDGVVAAEASRALQDLVAGGHNIDAYIAENTDTFLSEVADGVREKMSALGMAPDLSKQPGFLRDLVDWRKKAGIFD